MKFKNIFYYIVLPHALQFLYTIKTIYLSMPSGNQKKQANPPGLTCLPFMPTDPLPWGGALP